MPTETTGQASDLTVSTVDLSGADVDDPVRQKAIADQIDRSCRETGFFAITGHGVAEELRMAALETAAAFFARPTSDKQRFRLECPPGVQRGYTGIGAEAQALASGGTTPPDLSETFAIGSEPPGSGPFAFPNVWPDRPTRFRAVWIEYRHAMTALAEKLLSLCALSLRGDAHAFAPLVTSPIGATRANHYPALAAEIAPDQWRGGAHTDYGTLTILSTDGVAGLEIRTADGEWVAVEAPQQGYLVNIGDLLELLSDQRWRSTWHRVTTPPGRPPHPSRTSIAHFQFPDHDALIEGRTADGGALAISAGDYLTMKLSQLGSTDLETESAP